MMTTCSGRFFGGRRKIKICIHRGTRQIGGTCVEIDEAGQRLIIDLGLPLDADEPSSDLLPSAAGLTSPDRSLQAIVISHAHLDHYGLLPFVHAEIPVMVGEYLAIMRAAAPVNGGAKPRQRGGVKPGHWRKTGRELGAGDLAG